LVKGALEALFFYIYDTLTFFETVAFWFIQVILIQGN